MENNYKVSRQKMCPFTLSKSRFKSLIDQIETKLKKQKHQQKSHSVTSLLNKSQSFHSVEKRRILPSFFHIPIQRKKSKQNENRVSINLEFNKLVLNKKNKFVQHSPNSKDLMMYLPELNVPFKNHQNKSDKYQMHRESSRWKINPKITQNTMFLTQNQDLSEIGNHKKFKKINIDESFIRKEKTKIDKQSKSIQNQQKQIKKSIRKTIIESSQK